MSVEACRDEYSPDCANGNMAVVFADCLKRMDLKCTEATCREYK
jgi:hypothetical protein